MSKIIKPSSIWERQDPIDDATAFEAVRNARFSLEIPRQIKPGERKLIELIIRRWTSVGYWLDLNLLGKGRRSGYPLNLPGVRAEETWAEVVEALLKLCIACHPYRKLEDWYYWPNHLWLAVVNDIVQDDIKGVFEPCLKKATIQGKRNFINCLKKNKMPSFQAWGDFEHTYRLFETTVELNKGIDKSHKFITAHETYIRKYEADLTAYDRNEEAKAGLVRNGVLMVQMGRHPTAVGWRPLQLPKLPTNFWEPYLL